MDVLAYRVQVGAAYLDEYYPNWHNKIDLDRLEIESCTRCVLGQLEGNIIDAMIQRGMSWNESHEMGFDLEPSEWGWCNTLTQEWKQVILLRREEDKDENRLD